MNPSVDEAIVNEAYEEDEAAASAEYGAEFRRDIEAFLSKEAVDACTPPSTLERPPISALHYVAFTDPSGGSKDSFTLAIAHAETDKATSVTTAVLDAVREVRPPFSPDAATQEFAALLKQYRVSSVTGDRFGGEYPRERFRAHGIAYHVSERSKSDLYRELLPLVNSQRVELLDNKRLTSQLISLERRTARGGRDSIDHPQGPNAHDDVANAAAGALTLASGSLRRGRVGVLW